jgi:hypothetical protein
MMLPHTFPVGDTVPVWMGDIGLEMATVLDVMRPESSNPVNGDLEV